MYTVKNKPSLKLPKNHIKRFNLDMDLNAFIRNVTVS